MPQEMFNFTGIPLGALVDCKGRVALNGMRLHGETAESLRKIAEKL